MKKIRIVLSVTILTFFLQSCKEEKKVEESINEVEIETENEPKYETENTTSLIDFLATNPKLVELTNSIKDLNLEQNQFNTNNSKSIESLDNLDVIYCVNGSSKDANYLLTGNGRNLYIRFTEANWSNVRNTCGNYRPSNNRFTFPASRTYQYQMVLFEQAPSARNYWVDICEEGSTYYVKTKKGFKYYIYTNDTKGDHQDNDGYISYCYGLN